MRKLFITKQSILLFMFLWLPLSYTHGQVEVLDTVVAIVDEDIVLASEVNERLAALKAAAKAQNMELPVEEVLATEALDRLILESIQMQLADRFGVRISEEQLDASMRTLAEQNSMSMESFRQAVEASGQSYIEMRESLRNELAIQRVQQGSVMRNINITDREIDNFLKTEEGMALTEPEYRVLQALIETTRGDSKIEVANKEAFVDGVLANILAGTPYEKAVSVMSPYSFKGGDLGWRRISDLPSMFAQIVPSLEQGATGKVKSGSGFHLVHIADIRGLERLVEQTETRHILIELNEVLSEKEAEALAESLRDRILSGEDFTKLAREYSDDIGSAQEGGKLGWINPGQMVPSFEAVMADSKIGDISKVFRSEFGWHLMEVTGRRTKDFSAEMRRASVANYLREIKYGEELNAWLRKIREEAFIDIK